MHPAELAGLAGPQAATVLLIAALTALDEPGAAVTPEVSASGLNLVDGDADERFSSRCGGLACHTLRNARRGDVAV